VINVRYGFPRDRTSASSTARPVRHRAWAAQLTKDSASMSVAGLVVANGTTLPGRPALAR